eukprot:scaffold3474_cov246-Pinguiococcus_pyrenoidosus.AAC.8
MPCWALRFLEASLPPSLPRLLPRSLACSLAPSFPPSLPRFGAAMALSRASAVEERGKRTETKKDHDQIISLLRSMCEDTTLDRSGCNKLDGKSTQVRGDPVSQGVCAAGRLLGEGQTALGRLLVGRIRRQCGVHREGAHLARKIHLKGLRLRVLRFHGRPRGQLVPSGSMKPHLIPGLVEQHQTKGVRYLASQLPSRPQRFVLLGRFGLLIRSAFAMTMDRVLGRRVETVACFANHEREARASGWRLPWLVSGKSCSACDRSSPSCALRSLKGGRDDLDSLRCCGETRQSLLRPCHASYETPAAGLRRLPSAWTILGRLVQDSSAQIPLAASLLGYHGRLWPSWQTAAPARRR